MKTNSKRTKKVRNLVLVCVLTAVLLTVSTYAWFIGMQTVKVNQFEIEIAGVDNLLLSMDGENWDTTVTPGTTAAYANNTNQFLEGSDEGLIPMSSVGDFELTTSRMKLFQKGSLTATSGGYRLMASLVDNSQVLTVDDTAVPGQYQEADGYVAFDLFVMNLSGEAYYNEITTPSNEEAIYLTYDSKVEATGNGADVSGIDNSVRVAFAQIGRVDAEYGYNEDKTATITGITCNLKDGVPAYTAENGVTGICRDAHIWEPNESDHVPNALTWYEKSCKPRTADNDKFAYSTGACKNIEGIHYKTAAVKDVIMADDYIDVYDGELNGHTISAAHLEEVDTFTDYEKLYTGNQRKELMTLAPNSITKIRVYIWLEGQDVDNFDFASLGEKITVNFGFTKERYTTDEIEQPDNNLTEEYERYPENPSTPAE